MPMPSVVFDASRPGDRHRFDRRSVGLPSGVDGWCDLAAGVSGRRDGGGLDQFRGDCCLRAIYRARGIMSDWVSGGLFVAGATFALLAGVGVLRMPDVFTRMQAS